MPRRYRTQRNHALHRAQLRLGWWAAATTFVGIGLGMMFGNLAVGAAVGLTLGLAIGLLAAG